MIFTFEDFELDAARRELRSHGTPREIQRQAFALLELLLNNPDRMVSKDELIDAIWDGRIISDTALNSCVKLARKAVDDDGVQQRLIKTVRGSGFRFMGDVSTSCASGSVASPNASRTSAEPVLPEQEPDRQIRFFKDRHGANVAYSVMGSGPLLICPPWWVTHVESDWNVPDLRRFYIRAGRAFTTVLYDRPGCGLSDPTDRAHSLHTEAELLEDVVRELGATSYSLLALSCAGPAAIQHASVYPDAVQKLAFFGSYASGPSICPKEVEEAMIASIKAHWGLGSRQIADSFLPDLSREQVLEFASQIRAAADAETAAKMLRLVYAMDSADRMPLVKAPSLVVHRRGERAIPFEAAQAIAKGIPGAILAPIEGRAHSPWYDDGKIAEKLNEFLTN